MWLYTRTSHSLPGFRSHYGIQLVTHQLTRVEACLSAGNASGATVESSNLLYMFFVRLFFPVKHSILEDVKTVLQPIYIVN
jgi:hypothetical protein